MLLAGLVFLALGTCGAPLPQMTPKQTAAYAATCGTVAEFYHVHPNARLWTQDGRLTARGRKLLALLSGAAADGLQLSKYRVATLDEGSLSAAFYHYVGDLSGGTADQQFYYVDSSLRHVPPCAASLLEGVLRENDLDRFIKPLQEPNVLARTIRDKLALSSDRAARARLAQDLAVARSLGTAKRMVVVDTNAQQLSMIEDGRVAGQMKVVVGKSGMDTPPMAALIRYAVVNPYWYIPPDIVQHELAPRVASSGTAYLASRNYEPVTSYDGSGVPVDPAAVDWNAVSAGKAKIGLRQAPGAGNMMGRVMFMFPNKLGIYLHDTPAHWVFQRENRHLSHGCVRLEDAGALYQWLFRRPLSGTASGSVEEQARLENPVPVYIVRFASDAWKA